MWMKRIFSLGLYYLQALRERPNTWVSPLNPACHWGTNEFEEQEPANCWLVCPPPTSGCELPVWMLSYLDISTWFSISVTDSFPSSALLQVFRSCKLPGNWLRFQVRDGSDESTEGDSSSVSMQIAVEKVPGSKVCASEALQSLCLHLRNREPSLWVFYFPKELKGLLSFWHSCVKHVQIWCHWHSSMGLYA
jgi:hypothetical protein